MHVADFCEDPRFVAAYKKGRSTGSWGKVDLRWRAYTACWAAELALRLPGDFVECGVNRGGLALAVMEYVNFKATNKQFFLVDTFCGFPEEMRNTAAVVNANSYDDCYPQVVETFRPFQQVRIIRGSVPTALEEVDAEKVCYLSVDMNCSEPEIAALRFFWPKLVAGAMVVLDDYAYSEYYRRQKDAFDALGKELGFRVLSLPTGQGLIIKI
jgi:hypothetical protein